MKKDNKYKLDILVSGDNLSLREITNINQIFETVLVLSVISFDNQKDQENRFTSKFDQFIEKKYKLLTADLEKEIRDEYEVRNSIDLLRIYDPEYPYYYERGRGRPSPRGGLADRFNYLFSLLEKKASGLESLKTYKYGGKNFSFYDFHEWIAEYFGNEFFKVEEVNTKNSYQLIIDLASLAAILTLQDYSLLKDIIQCALGILSQWRGASARSEEIFPDLPPNLAKTIVKYSKVDLSFNPKTREYKLKLTK